MKINGAIFDLDGTLLDSMFIWDTIGEEYLRSRGIEPHEDLREKFKSMSLYQASCYYQSEYGLSDSTDEIMEGVNRMISHLYADEVMLKPGVLSFLQTLKKQHVKMCIATATDRHLVEPALIRCGVRDYFGEIFTCTSVGHGKDEPHIYDIAQQFLGTDKANTWVFEDAVYAVKTAKNAGFPVVGVYDRTEKATNRVREIADRYIDSFDQAEALFQ